MSLLAKYRYAHEVVAIESMVICYRYGVEKIYILVAMTWNSKATANTEKFGNFYPFCRCLPGSYGE